MDRLRTVGEAARLAGVTVRTLHHYDAIGLLSPAGRSGSGYRLYADSDLERLHQIVLLRDLGLSLEAIGRVLDAPEYDRASALRSQRRALEARVRRTRAMIRAVDAAIQTLDEGATMAAEELFDGFDPTEYEKEAEERWGGTEAFQESLRRTKGYGEEDWKRMSAEADVILSGLAEHMAAGRRPDALEVMDAAEAHRLHIDRWFYRCGHDMHVALSRLYVDDPRFRDYFERRREGLTEFLASAIRANGRRAAG